TITDYLSNARISFADLNNNGIIEVAASPGSYTEIVQENHYYPFGMHMEGPWSPTIDVENRYQYNGMEYDQSFGLNLNFATFRTLDASTGRWWGVDMKAKSYSMQTPYNSMLNNPVRYIDPSGDDPLLIGAIIGIISNGIGNSLNGRKFFEGSETAAKFGAIQGGITAGIGSISSGISNSYTQAAFQIGAHSVSSGLISTAQGGEFWHGALSGAFSSYIGSGIGALNGGDFTQLLGGGISGGIGSVVAGGKF